MQMRDTHRPALRAGLISILLAACTACVMPVRNAPGITGKVVDRTNGAPIAGAVVVVRFDGRYGDKLPDRELLGHAETVTGADGTFHFERHSSGGLSVWPLFKTETRVVAVLRTGYRCAAPQHVSGANEVRVPMQPALDLADQQSSCRPVPSRRGETEQYRTAWRKLYPAPESPEQREQREQLARSLDARRKLGFGGNCEGPVTDLALSPGGEHVAFAVRGKRGSEVEIVEVTPEGTRAARSAGTAPGLPPRRLAWSRPGELVLWTPADLGQRSTAASVMAGASAEVVWSNLPILPAAIDPEGTAARARTPLEPQHLSDEADTRWNGRTFSLEDALELASGLPHDRLLVRRDDGSRYETELPGEACGGARFGRPHYRIGTGGRLGFDLRFVEGGCHAVAIDLDTGSWSKLDGSRESAQCREQRTIPPAQLSTALRGWTRELHTAMQEQGIDTGAAYALQISANGNTQVFGRNVAGTSVRGRAPRFPIDTPLRRIDVTHIAPHSGGVRGAPDAGPAKLAPL